MGSLFNAQNYVLDFVENHENVYPKRLSNGFRIYSNTSKLDYLFYN